MTKNNSTTNAYGLGCPIPLKYWPTWAKFATISKSGEFHFFSERPVFKPRKKTFEANGEKVRWGVLKSGWKAEECIWHRKSKSDAQKVKKLEETTYLINEHGLEAPIPLEYWPFWARYLTVDNIGVIYYQALPEFSEKFNHWNACPETDDDGIVVKDTHEIAAKDYGKALWIRP